MSRSFANHPKQNFDLVDGLRVARIKDGKKATFKWRPCPMNGHNDNAGSWVFEMDDGEVIYLNGYIYDSYPWRIPNRFRKLLPRELMKEAIEADIDAAQRKMEVAAAQLAEEKELIGVEWAIAEARKAKAAEASRAAAEEERAYKVQARICDLLDMIVDEKVKSEDYNYVVEQLEAMIGG